jgi:hypothetical protein
MRANCTSKFQKKKSEYIIQPTGKQLIAACIFSAYNSVQNDILPTYHFFYLKNKKIIWFSSTSYHKGAPSWPWPYVVGFTTTYIISAYHHWCCEFESRSGRGVQHYVIKFVNDLRQVSGFLRFPPPIKLTATILLKYCWKWH